MGTKKHYSPIVYLRNPERPFQGRDLTALIYLHQTLFNAGYELGTPTFQSPLRPSVATVGQRLADFPAAESADLLVLATRPPLDDDPSLDKRALDRSQTWLEMKVLDGLRTILAYCSRREVQLASCLAESIPPKAAHHLHQRYRIFVDKRFDRMAEYLEGESKHVIPDTTAGYVAFHPRLPGIERPLLSIFGMSGDDTLRLAWALGQHPTCSGLVQDIVSNSRNQRRVVMLEIEKADRPFNPLQPLDVDFHRVDVVIDTTIP